MAHAHRSVSTPFSEKYQLTRKPGIRAPAHLPLTTERCRIAPKSGQLPAVVATKNGLLVPSQVTTGRFQYRSTLQGAASPIHLICRLLHPALLPRSTNYISVYVASYRFLA